MTNQSNPLIKHFRKPGISITLPSKGLWYDDNIIDGDIETEIEIFPLTAADEIELKNPDSLLSGVALEKIIRSCAPRIVNVQKLISIDLDVLFLAIRSVTYGDDLELETVCPKCKQENSFIVSLNGAIAKIPFMTEYCTIKLEENLIVYVKPNTFENQLLATSTAFNESKALQVTKNIEDSVERDRVSLELMSKSFVELQKVKNKITLDSIEKIIMDELEITNKSHIQEFLENSHKKYNDLIDKKLEEINQIGANSTKQEITCISEKCKHTWETTLEINPVHFFA